MITQAILTGLGLGSFSSLHCIGMCGPIALSLPNMHLPVWQQRASAVLYNLGRVITYSLIGALLGVLGRQFQMGQIQQIISIVMGALVLSYAIHHYFTRKSWQPRFLDAIHQQVQKIMIHLLQSPTLSSFLLLGMANALLPCGMVYVALASALSFMDIEVSIAFMAAFGIGTLPLMLLVSMLGNTLRMPIRANLRKATPYMITIVGMLLILRGLNLNIPYLSPYIQHASTVVPCH
ncbi:MAG: sulfite exporter TauE/SafE family protein [Chitinophagaceae bacterium]